MGLRSFQAKLILLMVGVLLLLQIATLVAIHIAGRKAIHSNVAEELGVADRVLERILRTRGETLSDSVRILAADFAFREAIASDHRPTIVSVLQNHGIRIDADAALLVSLEGEVIADTLEGRLTDEPFPFSSMIASVRERGEA
ncbi:MAG: hypothetical protein R3338_03560, partial [Thermoanaerobaculia bacterium]|nr:hypothetical protein [Thermoanaerobaculia bacterium]